MSKEIDKNDAVGANFSNVADVHKYLKAQGWKISKTQLHHHVDIEKIKRDDGKFLISSIDKYALKYLRRFDGSKPKKDLFEIQKRRYTAELRDTEAGAAMKEMKLSLLKGEFVPRNAFEQALAQRAMFLKSDIQNFIHSQAVKIIAVVGGNATKAPDLIEFMLDQLAEWMDRYTADQEFAVPVPVPATQSLLNGDEAAEESDD